MMFFFKASGFTQFAQDDGEQYLNPPSHVLEPKMATWRVIPLLASAKIRATKALRERTGFICSFKKPLAKVSQKITADVGSPHKVSQKITADAGAPHMYYESDC